VGALTPSNLAALSSTQLAALTAAQMGGLTSSQIAGLSAAQLGALSATQVAALSAAQLASLSPEQLTSLGISPSEVQPASQLVAAVQASLPVPTSSVAMPSLSSQQLPPLLPAGNAAVASNNSSDGGYGTGATGVGSSVNTASITIDVRGNSTSSLPVLIAVGLPKGSATVGAGFSFDLPPVVREIIKEGTHVEPTTAHGGALPDWLRYDAHSMRFYAAAVPDRAFPIELQIRVGTQSIVIVISERTE